MATDPDRRARRLLQLVGAGFLPAVAIPLTADPTRWARRFGWPDAGATNELGIYLGRCLGVVAGAVSVHALRASRDPRAHRSTFDLLGLAALGLAAQHARGMAEGRQPATEDAETAVYIALAVACRWARP